MRNVDGNFEAQLKSVMPEDVFREMAPRYLEEPRGLFQGADGLLLAPRDVGQVSIIVAACNAAGVPVVPYGGGTGLVGGQVMPPETCVRPVILSFEQMNTVREIYPDENVVIAEAGVIVADLHTVASGVNRLFPLSLASEGSCRIGGCLSTNAGGVNVLRYGNARALCLGLEAVLPDGRIWHGLKRLRKDNTGYDLVNLLCGAEGTLGVITAASLRLFARPKSVGTALLVVNDPRAALDLLALAQDQLGEGISAFELISGTGLSFLEEAGMGGPQPFKIRPDWSVLIDLGLGRDQSAEEALARLFEAALEAGLVLDGVAAQSGVQCQALWRLREEIPLANRQIGSISSHDISLPLSTIPSFLTQADAALAALGPFRVNAFGHLGDGNFHYNVFPPKFHKKQEFTGQLCAIRNTIYDLVHRFDGSFSAEHGVGRLKPEELERYGDPVRLATMKSIKSALDPNGIMNPGVMFRDR